MNNPYRAYWEKAQEQSLKLGQYYTPECLVELCLELLQPTGELFDPCCGLGSFLLKGVIELVCQLPSQLFNQTGIAPTVWLLNKEKTEKDIYFLNAEKYSEWEAKKRILTAENIKQICDKTNWTKADLEQIKENNFCLAPNRFIPLEEKELQKWEINQQLIKCTYELRYSLHALIADAYQKLMALEEIDDSGSIQLQSCFVEGKKVAELQEKIKELMLDKYFKHD